MQAPPGWIGIQRPDTRRKSLVFPFACTDPGHLPQKCLTRLRQMGQMCLTRRRQIVKSVRELLCPDHTQINEGERTCELAHESPGSQYSTAGFSLPAMRTAARARGAILKAA
jgi:hypothetical protein